MSPANGATSSQALHRTRTAIEEGALAYLAETTGRQTTTVHEEFYAREATEEEVHHGIAKAGRPVLVAEFIAYDEDQRPITYEIAAHPEGQRISSGIEDA